MKTGVWEVNFDGLPGPTHCYGGLSYGNVASRANRLHVSNPKAAALQGLKKMKLLHDWGLKQGILPPHERPDFATLRRLGFTGTNAEILERSGRADAQLRLACFSSSAMWAANAATVSPSADTRDGRVHFTPANLVSQFHRSIETSFTARALKRIFRDDAHFAHHAPVPASLQFSDEGSANHVRLCRSYGEPGLELFVYGREASNPAGRYPARYPARQTREASLAVARLHELRKDTTLVSQQNPLAIDQGVFHNDVMCVGNRNLLWYHADAFLDTARTVNSIRSVLAEHCDTELKTVEVPRRRLSLDDAVQSYVFNSQLVTLPDQSGCVVAPSNCRRTVSARACIDALVDGDNDIHHVYYVDLEQSMHNGGGPACLRLRVVLTEEELAQVHEPVFLTEPRYDRLVGWVDRYFRDRLHVEDLGDPLLWQECHNALDELTGILDLGSLYDFQCG